MSISNGKTTELTLLIITQVAQSDLAKCGQTIRFGMSLSSMENS